MPGQEYPLPDVVDISAIPGLGTSRWMVALAVFNTPEEFMQWQRDEPREIYEITPKAVVVEKSHIPVPNGGGKIIVKQDVVTRIFVTYKGELIK